jgi:hypothetical protein
VDKIASEIVHFADNHSAILIMQCPHQHPFIITIISKINIEEGKRGGTCSTNGRYEQRIQNICLKPEQIRLLLDLDADEMIYNKKLCEELSAYFNLIRHGLHRKRKKLGWTHRYTDSKVIS